METNDYYQTVRDGPALADTDGPEAGSRFGHWALVLLLSMAVSAWVAVSLGQDVSWDVLNYHFYSGYAFLHKPIFYDFGAAQVQSFFNPLLHVLSYLMLEYMPSIVTAALLGAIQGLNFFLVFQISRALFRRWQHPYRELLSLGNAAAGFYGVVNIMELGATFGDNMVSVLTLAGLLLVIRYLLSDRPTEHGSALSLWIGGAGIGVAFALKLTVIMHVAALVIGMAVVLPALTRRVGPLIAFYAGLAAGFLAAYGFWGIALYQEYQNPVYPYLNNIFRSPYYDLLNAMDGRFMPRNWQETLFYPFFFTRKTHLAGEIEFRDARLACCYAATLLLAGWTLFHLIRRSRDRATQDTERREHWCLWMLTLFFVISYAAWQHIFSVYRYLSVLELLAPTFLALALSYFFRNRILILGLSLLLNLAIILSVTPINYGRQEFDDGFLKVEIPPITDLDKSVVLMVGDEATAYIIPRFPARTRFVRVSSNFVFPGRNAKLDQQVRDILAQYDITHTLLYVSNAEEIEVARPAISYFGVMVEDRPCREIRSRTGNKGYLCGVVPVPKPGEAPVSTLATNVPRFLDREGVKLEVTPQQAVAGTDTLQYRVFGLPAKAIDMLYTLNDQSMPPVRKWALDSQQTARIFVSATTRKGWYHIIGIRDSDAQDRAAWIKVDVRVQIR
jgi:hypothetical protein